MVLDPQSMAKGVNKRGPLKKVLKNGVLRIKGLAKLDFLRIIRPS